MPRWIAAAAALSIAVAILCAVWIAFDEARRPQPMAIMNVVWPVTALYGGPIGLWAYLAFGRAASATHHRHGGDHKGPPGFAAIAKGTTHCGAGCTLGDILAEALLALVPGLAVLLGWHSLWQDRIFSAWILDFILAFGLGILFQYFSIKPMHQDLRPAQALGQALQADALSLLAWQAGMYAVMALAHFWLFPSVIGAPLPSAGLAFWWVMQFAMMAGFAVSYPVNRRLIAAGVKAAM